MPVQELEFLGFLINSINMTISFTDAKMLLISEKILNFLALRKPSIKTLPLLLEH